MFPVTISLSVLIQASLHTDKAWSGLLKAVSLVSCMWVYTDDLTKLLKACSASLPCHLIYYGPKSVLSLCGRLNWYMYTHINSIFNLDLINSYLFLSLVCFSHSNTIFWTSDQSPATLLCAAIFWSRCLLTSLSDLWHTHTVPGYLHLGSIILFSVWKIMPLLSCRNQEEFISFKTSFKWVCPDRLDKSNLNHRHCLLVSPHPTVGFLKGVNVKLR